MENYQILIDADEARKLSSEAKNFHTKDKLIKEEISGVIYWINQSIHKGKRECEILLDGLHHINSTTITIDCLRFLKDSGFNVLRYENKLLISW